MSTAFGPNTALVQEVIGTMTADRLLDAIFDSAKPFSNAPEKFEFTRDWRKAIELATIEDGSSSGYTTWRFITESGLAPLLFPPHPVVPNFQTMRLSINRKARDLERNLATHSRDKARDMKYEPTGLDLADYLSNEIPVDFTNIALARLQFGVGYEPFETMFEAYKLGGWPCGWKDEYPEGKMVVYHAGAPA